MNDPLIIGLSRDHVGKDSKPRDRGASVDVDGDGIVEVHEHEAFFTALDLLFAETRLVEHGYIVRVYSDGDYDERHQRAAEDGCAIYVAHHRNALKGRITPTSGDYGSVFYDAATTRRDGLNGSHIADAICDRLARACPELDQALSRACSSRSWSRAYSTIRHLPPSVIGLCYEPCFIDQTKHQSLNGGDGPQRIGYSLADGIHDALTSGRQLIT